VSTQERASALGVDVVLRRSADLEWLEVDGEAVVWHRRHEQLHRLDPIGTLVFQLCDGVTPLGVTVRELGETFGRPQRVSEDVHQLVSALLGADVLERV